MPVSPDPNGIGVVIQGYKHGTSSYLPRDLTLEVSNEKCERKRAIELYVLRHKSLVCPLGHVQETKIEEMPFWLPVKGIKMTVCEKCGIMFSVDGAKRIKDCYGYLYDDEELDCKACSRVFACRKLTMERLRVSKSLTPNT